MVVTHVVTHVVAHVVTEAGEEDIADAAIPFVRLSDQVVGHLDVLLGGAAQSLRSARTLRMWLRMWLRPEPAERAHVHHDVHKSTERVSE